MPTRGYVVRHLIARALLVLMLYVCAPGVFGATGALAQEDPAIDVYLFWRSGCPFCEKARVYLAKRTQEIPDLRVAYLEVSSSEANRASFIAVSRALEIKHPVVPVVVVGSQAFVGYLDDATTGAAIRRGDR